MEKVRYTSKLRLKKCDSAVECSPLGTIMNMEFETGKVKAKSHVNAPTQAWFGNGNKINAA